jgi:Tfp pilus assembly protein PilV
MRYNRISMRANINAARKESGMASFLIVMIMMVVITLIVLGFSQVTRRNSREALDRQLSSQAFYAAESGVNATTSAISSYVKTNGYNNLAAKTTCPNNYDPSDVNGNGTSITALNSGVRYTCVLVNPNPSTLQYNPTQKGSLVFPVAANGNLKSLTFTWNVQSGGTDTNCTGANAQSFPQSAAWSCDFGILRLDLLANPTGNVNNLTANTTTLYLTPLGGHSGSITLPNFNSISHAYVASASGCTGGTCSVTVNLNPSVSSYAVRALSLYRDAPNMIISGVLAGNTAATFSGAQAVVDTTGQAQDELRRIQVRVQLSASADPDSIPAYGMSSSTDICKHFSIMPTANVNPADLCQ